MGSGAKPWVVQHLVNVIPLARVPLQHVHKEVHQGQTEEASVLILVERDRLVADLPLLLGLVRVVERERPAHQEPDERPQAPHVDPKRVLLALNQFWGFVAYRSNAEVVDESRRLEFA